MSGGKRTGRDTARSAPRSGSGSQDRASAEAQTNGNSEADPTAPFTGKVVTFNLNGAPSEAWSLIGQTYEDALDPWLACKPDDGGEQAAYCPLHETPGDSVPSASINFVTDKWNCFAGCGGGNSLGTLVWRMGGEEVIHPGPRQRPLADKRPPAPVPGIGSLGGWHAGLRDRTDLLDYLREHRGLPEEAVNHWQLGWDRDRQRFVIPVVEDGEVVNVRWYSPDRKPKMKGLPGHTTKRLFPHDEFVMDPSGPIFIVEGELDVLVLRHHGFNAVTALTGASGLANTIREHLDLDSGDDPFTGREIVIWTDADDSGRKARDELVRLLGPLAEVSVIELIGAGESADVTDAWRRLKDRFADRLRGLVIDPLFRFTGIPDYEIPYPWLTRNDGIYREKETKAGTVETKVTHAPLFITERWVDDEGSEAVRLRWPRDDTWREQVYDRDEVLVSRKIDRLAADGAPVGGSNLGQVANYLHDVEAANLSRIPIRRMTRRLGWVGEGTDEFIANLDDTTVEFHGLPGTEELAEAFRRSGSLARWKEAVDILRDHPRAALGIYAALAAPLLRVVDAPPFTVDLSGETSVGKTTVLKVSASVWGAPKLMFSWDATAVAVEHLAGTLFGLPLLLDETKRRRSDEHVAEVIYNVSQGLGRVRGARNGGLRDTVKWSTVLLSTGEQPITTFTTDGGTRGRVVSVWGSPFQVRDHRLVRNLTRDVSEHYGHAGPLFVSELLAHREEWGGWRRRYEDLVDELAAQTENAVVQRRAALVAVLRMAAGLAEKFGVLDWKPSSGFWSSLLTTGAGTEDDDQARVALATIWGWAAAHRKRFTSYRHAFRDPGHDGWVGRWDESSSEICLLPDVLRQLLERRDHDYDAVVKVWADRNWIRPDSQGRSQRVVRLEPKADNAVRMVVIREEVVRWLSSHGAEHLPNPVREGEFPPENLPGEGEA